MGRVKKDDDRESEAVRLIEQVTSEILDSAKASGDLSPDVLFARLLQLGAELQRIHRMTPAARALVSDIDRWRQQLQDASTRKPSGRIDRLDAELHQLQAALLAEPSHDATPEQYEAFLQTVGHRLGRSVAQLLIRLRNERKPRKRNR